MAGLTVKTLKKGTPPPWDLLLLADPSRAQVERYLRDGLCLVARDDARTLGVVVLLPTEPGTMELMNIAVAENRQGQGIGKRLMAAAVRAARRHGAHRLDVGTGNSSIGQLAFYQKNGFRIVGVRPDYFREHYPERIVENGIECRDMVRLRRKL